MKANGTFEVEVMAEPPYDVHEGVSLSRVHVEKRFEGALSGTSKVDMLAVGTPVEGSGAYVATERIVGTLDGKAGSFVVMHRGTRTRDGFTLSIDIVASSGTGELEGIAGRIEIQIVEGKHFYEVDYTLAR